MEKSFTTDIIEYTRKKFNDARENFIGNIYTIKQNRTHSRKRNLYLIMVDTKTIISTLCPCTPKNKWKFIIIGNQYNCDLRFICSTDARIPLIKNRLKTFLRHS